MFKNLTHQLMQTTAATNALLKASSKTFLSARTPNIHEISCLVSRTLKATDLGLLLNRWPVAIVKRRKCISFFESVTVNDGWCHSLEANKIQVKDCKRYTGYHLDTNIAFSDVPILRCGGRKTLFFLRSGDDFYKNFISSKAEGASEFFSGRNTTLLS